MTEAEARELFRRCDGAGGLEAWIARQSWQKMPGEGWSVMRDLQGWRFRVCLWAWPPDSAAPTM